MVRTAASAAALALTLTPLGVDAQQVTKPTAADVTAALYAFSITRPDRFQAALAALTPQQAAKLSAGVAPCLDAARDASAWLPDWRGQLPDMVQALPGNFGNTQIWAQDMRRTLAGNAVWTDTVTGQVAAKFETAQPMFCAIAPAFCEAFPEQVTRGFHAAIGGTCN